MNLMFVIPYVPSLVRVRSYQIIRHLKVMGHRIVLATVWTNEIEREELEGIAEFCDEVIAQHIPAFRSILNCFWAMPTRLPLQAVYSWDFELWKKVRDRVLETGDTAIDAVHIEHLRGSQYAVRLQSLFYSLKRVSPVLVWDSVDCISHLFRQVSIQSSQGIKRQISQFDLKRTENREGQLVNWFDRVLVTSRKDRDALLKLTSKPLDSNHVEVLPNGVDLDYFRPGDYNSREKASLVVSGKMSYHANVNMVLFLVREVMPLVWKSRSDVKLNIVGKDPAPQILALGNNSNINVTGTVPSLLPYLQTATVSVAPIQYGAGIQNKVLEAMACETPVIGSSIAISALSVVDGREVLVADTPSEWAKKILEVLSSSEKQKSLGINGYQYVQTHHRWSEIVNRLERIYSEKSMQ